MAVSWRGQGVVDVRMGWQLGQLCATLARHTEPVSAAVWLPNGQRLITGSLDRTIRTWVRRPPPCAIGRQARTCV
jgi:WD40 repeat protein